MLSSSKKAYILLAVEAVKMGKRLGDDWSPVEAPEAEKNGLESEIAILNLHETQLNLSSHALNPEGSMSNASNSSKYSK